MALVCCSQPLIPEFENVHACQVRTANVRSSKDKEGSRLKQQKRQIQILSKQNKQLHFSISAAKKEAAQLRMQVCAFAVVGLFGILVEQIHQCYNTKKLVRHSCNLPNELPKLP